MEQDFNRMVAAALRNELGDSRRAVKTVMNWTDSCERTAKTGWQAAVDPAATIERLDRHIV